MTAHRTPRDDTHPALEPFFRGLALRRLVIPRRHTDGEVLHFATRLAPDKVDWSDASGLARLHAYTVLWQAYRADIAVPYNVAWVELDEGPRLISAVRTTDMASLRVGMRLVASFDTQGMLVFDPVVADEDISRKHG